MPDIQPSLISGLEHRGGAPGLVVVFGMAVLRGGHLGFDQVVDPLQVLGGLLCTGLAWVLDRGQCGLDPVPFMCNPFPVGAPIIHKERMQVNRAAHGLRMILKAEVVAIHHTLEIL